jgi:hypothetical protein
MRRLLVATIGAATACFAMIDESAIGRRDTSGDAGGDVTTRDTGVAAPEPVFLADGQRGPIAIATNGTDVFWSNLGDATIMMLPVGGGLPSILARGARPPALDIAVAANDVVWGASFTIFRGSRANGAVAFAPPSTACPDRVGAAERAVFVADECSSGRVLRIEDDRPDASAILFVGDYPFDPVRFPGLAIANGHVFATIVRPDGADTPDGVVETVLTDGGGRARVASGQSNPGAIAADERAVYWTTSAPSDGGSARGQVLMRPLPSGPIVTVADTETRAVDLAVDARYVYWATEGTAPDFIDGALWRRARDGTTAAEVIVPRRHRPASLTIDASSIYWTELAFAANVALDAAPPSGTVWKLAR